MVKVKAHRGEPLNLNADTRAESARQLPPEHRQWTTGTQTMTYEWRDNDGVTHVTAWSKAVRSAMLRGGAKYQMQRALNRAVDNWIKIFMRSTDSGLQRNKQATNTGAQSDLMDSTRWGWRWQVATHDRCSYESRMRTRERKTDSGATNVLVETVAHIQSAGCKAQKKIVIGAQPLLEVSCRRHHYPW